MNYRCVSISRLSNDRHTAPMMCLLGPTVERSAIGQKTLVSPFMTLEGDLNIGI